MHGRKVKLAMSQCMTKAREAQQEQYNQLEYCLPRQSCQTLQQRSPQSEKLQIANQHLKILVIQVINVTAHTTSLNSSSRISQTHETKYSYYDIYNSRAPGDDHAQQKKKYQEHVSDQIISTNQLQRRINQHKKEENARFIHQS